MTTNDIIPSYVKVDIYKITNKNTNKQYVGQARTHHKNKRNKSGWSLAGYKNRFNQHLKESRTDKTNVCRILNRSIRKHGEDVFVVDLIETCSIDVADEKEIYWIDKLNTLSPGGYNLRAGGINKHGVCSDETIELLSKNLKRAHLNDPTLVDKMSAKRIGIKHPNIKKKIKPRLIIPEIKDDDLLEANDKILVDTNRKIIFSHDLHKINYLMPIADQITQLNIWKFKYFDQYEGTVLKYYTKHTTKRVRFGGNEITFEESYARAIKFVDILLTKNDKIKLIDDIKNPPEIKRDKNGPKRIRGVHINTGEIIEYDSMAGAFRKDKFCQSSISLCCRGKKDYYRRYKWSFIE